MAERAPDDVPENPTEDAPVRRSRWRRLLRIGAIISGVLLALILIAVVCVLYTGAGGATVAYGLSMYDDMIPGEVAHGTVEGSPGGGLVIEDLVLRDRGGAPLVTIERVHLELSPGQLFRLDAVLDGLTVEGVRIDLPFVAVDGANPFADLGPPPSGEPPEPEPEKTSTGIGPDLPLRIDGAIDVRRVSVRQQDADGAWQSVIDEAHLSVRTEAEGRTAVVRIDSAARIELPGVPVDIERVATTLRWASPRLTVETLDIATDVGRVGIEQLVVDAEARTIDGTITIDGRAAPLAERFGLPVTHDPHVTLVADDAGGLLNLAAVIDGGQGAWVWLDARAQISERPEIEAEIRVDGVDPARFADGLPPGNIGLKLGARATGTGIDDLAASIDLECIACALDGVGPVALSVFGGLRRGHGIARITARTIGVGVEADAEIYDFAALQARATVDVPDAAETLRGLSGLVPDLPEIEGGARLAADCVGTLADPACSLIVDVERFRGFGARLTSAVLEASARPRAGPDFAVDLAARDLVFGRDRFTRLDVRASGTPRSILATIDGISDRGDRLRFAAQALPGPPLDVQLMALDGRVRGVRLDLADQTAVTVESSGRTTVEALSLAVAGGRIAADGVFDPSGESDIRLDLKKLDLARIARLVPGLDIAGRVDLSGRFSGAADDPDLSVDGRLRGLRFNGTKLGSARIAAGFDDRRLTAKVDLTGGLAKAVTLDARVPFDMNLAEGQVGPRFAGPQRVTIAIDDLQLSRLQPFMGDTPAPTGRVDVKGRFDGARAPKGGIDVTLRDVEAMGWRVDRADLKAGYDARHASAELTVQSPYAETVRFEAKAPLRVDLSRSKVAWQKTRRHDARLVVGGVDFAVLGEKIPALAGLIQDAEVDLVVEGPATRPTIELSAAAMGIRKAGLEIERVSAAVTVEPEAAGVVIDARTPLADKVILTAAVPIRLRPLGKTPVAWLPDDDHALALDIRKVQLERIPQLGGRLRGRLNVGAQLTGTGRAPDLSADVLGLGLWFDESDLGRLEVQAGVLPDGATVDARWQADSDTGLVVHGEVPLSMDPPEGRFEWRSAAEHVLDLRWSGIDRALLAPFAPLPEGIDPVLTLAIAGGGTPKSFTVDADIDGTVGLPTGHRSPVQGRIRLRPESQTVSIKSPLDGSDLEISIAADAPVAALADGTADVNTIGYDATIKVPALPLAPLSSVVPPALYGPDGELYLDLSGVGTVGAPAIEGTLGLRGGVITVVDLSQRIEGIELAAAIDADGVRIDTLKAKSGKGSLKGSGAIGRTVDGAKGQVVLKLDQWPVVRPGIPRMLIHSDITTGLTRTPGDTRIKVDIAKTEVRLIGGNVPAPRPAPSIDGLVFVGDEPAQGPTPPVADADPPEDPASEPESPTPDASADRLAVEVALVDPLEIVGQGVAMQWDGRIVSVTDGPNSSVEGALRSLASEFSLLGRRFVFTRGRVYLPASGGLPYLDIEATTNVGAYAITATIRGKPDRPELTFRSEPALPDYQVLTVLVTGAPEAGGDSDAEGGVSSEALALLAAFASPEIEDTLNTLTGLDRVGIESSSTGQPVVSGGVRITPDLYVELAHRFGPADDENENEVRVKYRITPSWSLETTSGDKGVSALELFWVKHFGGSQAAPDTVDALPPAEPEPEPQP